MHSELFDTIVSTEELIRAADDRAWLRALLDAETALALALADVAIVPRQAATEIASVCSTFDIDIDELGRESRGGGNPVVPLVSALRRAVSAENARWVHYGATSQDIMDTAMMLVAKRALVPVERELVGVARGCAVLADRHRQTVMVGRTLLQQAMPLSFGLKAASWLSGILAALDQLRGARSQLAVQLGGPVGCLAAYETDGPAVIARFAAHLDLVEPDIPWHSARQRVVTLGSALGLAAGTVNKISRDVALLMQTEVQEAAEPAAVGRGGSSSMPHKRNPVGAAAVSSATRRVHALLPVLFGALSIEHERDLGGWQAEWSTMSELLVLAGGAIAITAETVSGLEVDEAAMTVNLERNGGLVMSERVATVLAQHLGSNEANMLVTQIGSHAHSVDEFIQQLLANPAVSVVFDRDSLTALFDPASYLGATEAFIDRVLDSYNARVSSTSNSSDA